MQLKFGQFIGQLEKRAHANGYAFAGHSHRGQSRLPLHSHVDAHFVLIRRGEYWTEADTSRLADNAAPVVVYNPPGICHRDQFRSEAGSFFTVSVGAQHTDLLANCGLLGTDAHAFGAGDLSLIMSRMQEETAYPDALTPLVLEGLALELVGAAARHLRCAPSSGTAPAWLKRAVAMMRERCCDVHFVTEVAHAVGVHPLHLARVMRSQLGATPGQMLRRFRVERAAALLTSTGRTLTDIALTCGYADQSQFTRSFRKSFGTTPGAYRRRTRCT